MIERLLKYLLPTVIFLMTVSASFAQQRNDEESMLQLQKLARVFNYMNSLYVDDVDMQPIVESAIREMLAELDPHSAYLDAEESSAEQVALEGEFSGIGVEFNIMRDTIIVVNPVVGSPAEQVGIKANDRIIRIDTINAVGFRTTDVPKYLRGKRGTIVEVEVVRRGSSQPLHFRIRRDNIPINTLSASYMIDSEVGYIKIDRFGRTTYREFVEAFDALKKQGLKSLVLDLRGNGGGLLEAAIELAGFFLPRESVVVSTEGRALPAQSYTARFGGQFTRGGVVVMIDENSASASEIVSGALQDWDRAIIIGRSSFGKGLVQRQIALPDRSVMRLTVARYHTPSGRVIQRPYERGHKKEYYESHFKRFTAEGMNDTTDSIEKPAYETKLHRRTVYGGGGIHPDIRVAVDTTGVSDYMVELVKNGIIREYTMNYLDTNRTKLDQLYPDFESFDKGFNIGDDMIEQMVQLAEENKVTRDDKGLDESRALIERQIKALTAQRLFSTTEFYRVVNKSDSLWVGQAINILHNWNKYSDSVLKGKITKN